MPTPVTAASASALELQKVQLEPPRRKENKESSSSCDTPFLHDDDDSEPESLEEEQADGGDETFEVGMFELLPPLG